MGLKKLAIEDRAAVLRLRVELFLKDHDNQEAWRSVAELRSLTEKFKHHRGVARSFHLACSACISMRVSPLRRSDASDLPRMNAAIRPLREVDFLRALILETEDRTDEANSVWTNLSRAAAGTYYGRVAQNRIQDLGRHLSEVPEVSIPTGVA